MERTGEGSLLAKRISVGVFLDLRRGELEDFSSAGKVLGRRERRKVMRKIYEMAFRDRQSLPRNGTAIR